MIIPLFIIDSKADNNYFELFHNLLFPTVVCDSASEQVRACRSVRVLVIIALGDSKCLVTKVGVIFQSRQYERYLRLRTSGGMINLGNKCVELCEIEVILTYFG
jgi:hypothetical protein